jgi:hypothetical protein
MLLNLILPFLCRKIQARIKNCQSSKNFDISVLHAISVIGPDSHAISVAGAKQKLDLKKRVISVSYAISINVPEDYAISVPRVKKQGKDQRGTLQLART